MLPLQAEPSPAALHRGQFCSAKGAGYRQLCKGGSWGRQHALANSLLDAAHLCNRWMGRRKPQRCICIHSALTLTLQSPQWHKGLQVQMLYTSRRKGGALGKGSHLAPVPGRSLLSADGSGQGRSPSGSRPREHILNLM